MPFSRGAENPPRFKWSSPLIGHPFARRPLHPHPKLGVISLLRVSPSSTDHSCIERTEMGMENRGQKDFALSANLSRSRARVASARLSFFSFHPSIPFSNLFFILFSTSPPSDVDSC